MSSEGSVSTSTSSRIRQFGLYRTIDARTEEFLRLSRKRQIKQGCACAAISTAITVTVVITVFLVYMEYGMNTDTQQALGKAGWIGLLNDSLASSFEEKFSKSKIDFDRNTIKLLPILIKALKQNRYLEKIIEDYSSSSPAYDGKVTTEFSFKKDIFLNTKNWMKKPSSKLYTIEYKTSPLVYVKNPTKKPGYFTKNRKIRDYKRIMEYVEKMINDKVGLGSTAPMNKPQSQTEGNFKQLDQSAKPFVQTKSYTKHKNAKKTTSKKKGSKSKQEDIVSCKCPKQLSLLIDKIISSIQQLLPDDKIYSKSGPCNGDQYSNNLEPDPDLALYPTKIRLPTTAVSTISTSNAKTPTPQEQRSTQLKFSEFDNVYHKEGKTSLPEETSTSRLKYLNNLKLFEANRHENLKKFKIEDTIAPYVSTSTKLPYPYFIESNNLFQSDKMKPLTSIWDGENAKDPHMFAKTTLVYDHIEPTEDYHDKRTTTQPMPTTIYIEEMENKYLKSPSTTEKKSIHDTEKINTTEIDMSPTTNLMINSDKFIPSKNVNTALSLILKMNRTKNSATTTAKNVLGDMNKFNIDSFELMKSKLLPPNKRQTTVKYPASNMDYGKEYTSSTTENYYEDSTISSSTESLVTSTQRSYYSYAARIVPGQDKRGMKQASRSKDKYKEFAPFKIVTKNATNENKVNVTNDFYKNKQALFYLGLENIALEDEIEKITREDEYQEQLSLKQAEDAIQNTKNNTNKTQDTNYFWQFLKSNERFYGPNSMLPQNRPTYLEIHRNDWKHEDNKDYDTDMKYNIFDLLK